MKPYFLVMHNRIKYGIASIRCPGFSARGILLLGRNTRFLMHKTAEVQLGDRVVSDGRLVMVVDARARLKIGDRVYFNEGTMISCKDQIEIGSGCRFGPNVMVFDNDHKYDAAHGVSAEHSHAPIMIGENCWIAANAVILKGTRIGKNSVIGAGCVVSGEIPDGSVVTMNRALVIEPMRQKES